MEVARAAQILRFFAGEAFRPRGELYEQAVTGSTLYTVRRALGVVGADHAVELPRRHPGLEAAPALAYGNTVVMKLAQEAPLTRPAPGVLLRGGRHPGGRVQRRRRPRLRRRRAARGAPGGGAISFTGSVAGRRAVWNEATARVGKRVQLELGGQNPLIVMADADLDRAVEASLCRGVLVGRPEVHVDAAHLRAGRGATTFRERLLERIGARRRRRPARPRHRGRPARERGARSRRCWPGSTADATGRHGAGGRRAARRELLRRADAVRGRRRRRVPLLRGGVRAGRLALPLRRPRRGARAGERRALRPLRVDLHARRPRPSTRSCAASRRA